MTQPPPPPDHGYGHPQQPPPYGQPPYPHQPPYPYPYPQSPAPAPARRWWQHPALIIVTLFLFPPGGIALAWRSRWNRPQKVVATVLAGIWFLTPFMGDPPQDPKGDAKPVAAATPTTAAPASPTPAAPPSFVGQNLKSAKSAASKAGYDVTSHDASDKSAGQWDDDNWKVCFQTVTAAKAGRTPALDFGVVRVEWPCPAHDGEPIPYPKMPAVVGQTFAKASETLGPLELKAVEAGSAYLDVTLPAGVGDWTVCFQAPKEGKELEYPKTVTAHLKVTAPGTACPATEYTRLHPDPTPPAVTDDDSTSGSSSSGSSSSGGSSSGGSGSAYYENCAAVRAAGKAPLHRGDPGYSRKLDRDGDGTACE